MDASELQDVSTPVVKFEASPAESFLSTPGDSYPSLFEDSSTMNPLESVMTPGSTADDYSTPGPECSSDKKQPKKRKSWGQVLPEPKTNLPPRKRAKTEDEKEQRRVERVLRNRRAAQSSRERKRQEVEALEAKCRELEQALHSRDKTVELLMEKLQKGSGRSVSPFEGLQPSPLTLSQPLFGADESSQKNAGMMDDFIHMPESNGTCNPASISPELTPVPDATEPQESNAKAVPTAAPTPVESSPDMTQHPAAVLCDQQCQSVEVPLESRGSRTLVTPALSLYLQLQLLLIASSVMLSAVHRPLTWIAGALKNNSALPPTPSILSTIIWMVTRPPNFKGSTSSTSSVTKPQSQARPRDSTRTPTNPNLVSASSTLRIKSLQKLLTSSPILARPLTDATMELLRLVSEGRDDRVEELATGSPGIKGDRSRGPLTWPDGSSLPSREVLLTLLWVIRVEERKLSITAKDTTTFAPGFSLDSSSVSPSETPSQNFVLSQN